MVIVVSVVVVPVNLMRALLLLCVVLLAPVVVVSLVLRVTLAMLNVALLVPVVVPPYCWMPGCCCER